VLASLGDVHRYDEAARAQLMRPEQRLHVHRERSGPVMGKVHIRLSAQFDGNQAEPNSGLGTTISCLLRCREILTLLLRHLVMTKFVREHL
jgi:hypothetical protein